MKFYCLILFIISVLTGCASGEGTVSSSFYDVQPDRIAVLDIAGDIEGKVPKNQVEDYFTMEMLDKGYQVVERERVNSLLEEMDFQHSDVTTDQEAAELGEILNISATVLLDVNVNNGHVSLTGRMVEAETGDVLWIGQGDCSRASFLRRTAGAVSGGLLGYEAADEVGAAIGGVLGGAVGNELTPEESEVVQNAIKHMVEDVPQI